MKYHNRSSTSEEIIRKEVHNDYIASYSKVVPKDLCGDNPKKVNQSKVNVIIVCEDLTKRHSDIYDEDDYIIFGFHVSNPVYS